MIFLKPADETLPVDFDAAKAAWSSARTRLRTMIKQKKRLETALILARQADPDPNTDRAAALRTELASDIERAQKYPKRVAVEIEEIDYEIDLFEPQHNSARDTFRIAAGEEACRIATELQPRHRAAVAKMANALEALSRAIAEERSVREEFAATAPEPTSCLLPNISSSLRFADLSTWDSPASQWARDVTRMKVIT